MIYSDEWPFEVPSNLQDVSEPLKEYKVGSDGSLTLQREPWLLGVKVEGKWGWINKEGRFIIPPIYDYGFVLCYNDIIILEKNGKYGGLFSNGFQEAFEFKYNHLSYAYGKTYVARNNSDMCALVQPGDKMLTGFNYIGFMQPNGTPYTEFVKKGFLGNRVTGRIDLSTGREL